MRDFADLCREIDISDLTSTGCFYTWSNNNIQSKIDRAMFNQAWMVSTLMGFAEFIAPGVASDHTVCVVKVGYQGTMGPRPFRFFNMWVDDEDFGSIVEHAWGHGVEGTAQFILAKKLKALKPMLKSLNDKKFSHISERVKRKEDEAVCAQRVALGADATGPNPLIITLKNDLLKLKLAERGYYRQKAKCDFLMESDRSTKFFHGMVKRNAKRNFIASLTNEDGTSTRSLEEVAANFVSYYEGLLGTSVDVLPLDSGVFAEGPLVELADCDKLTAWVTNEEIKSALFSIGDEKSPGPDGYSSCFFKKAWSVVGDDFSAAVSEFFANSALLKQLNNSVIALIPKGTHNLKVSDYRPISCCNIVYKTITKILSARITTILDGFIDKAQGAFIPGRLMSDNVMLLQELLRGYNRKRMSPRCTFKVDIRKAYDTVSWDFLREALLGFGFPTVFVTWVMVCVETPSYSISLNGCLHGFFKGRRGLRQGDPMSPYLFIICLKYLSRSIKRATTNTDFNFHPKCEKLKITHLAFADDLMLLCRGDPISMNILLDCLEDFGAKSGLRMNPTKSNIYCAGIEDSVVNAIQVASRLLKGEMPFRYLGIPLAAERVKVMHYSPLIDKIVDLMKGWRGETLSFAGRSELIASVVQGIYGFWGGAAVAWDTLARPKLEGGVGFKDLESWNLALLSRVVWNICAKKDTLWVRWVNQVYLNGNEFWDWCVHKRDSPLLKAICMIKDKLLVGSSREQALDLLKGWFMEGGRKGGAYDFFRSKGSPKPWHKLVWFHQAVPKHSFILYFATLGRLKTKDRIMPELDDVRCTFCGYQTESSKHLFFDCPLSARVWGEVKRAFGIRRRCSSLAMSLKWLKKEASGTSWRAIAKRIVLSATTYTIWIARNRKYFEGETPSENGMIKDIMTCVFRSLYVLYPHLANSTTLVDELPIHGVD